MSITFLVDTGFTPSGVKSIEKSGKADMTLSIYGHDNIGETVAMRFVRDVPFPHAQFACVCGETFEVDHKHLTASATDQSMIDLVMQCDHCGKIFSMDFLRKFYREVDPSATFMQ